MGVINVTGQPWYVALYIIPHNREKSAQRFSQVKRIEPGATIELPRPDFTFANKTHNDRVIVFYENTEPLHRTLKASQYMRLPKIKAGVTKGNTFYIGQNETGITKGYNIYEYKRRNIPEKNSKLANKIYQAVINPRIQSVRNQYLRRDTNPWYGETAYVRTYLGVGQQEQAVLQKRDLHIRASVEKLIGRPLKDTERTPRIALVCSGGGFRAMFSTLGVMRGAYETGLWDALSYVVGLSGSTWAISPYMVSYQTIPDFVKTMQKRTDSALTYATIKASAADSGKEVTDLLLHQLLSRLGFHQTLSLVDVYGFLLGRYLLPKTYWINEDYAQPEEITLPHQKDRVEKASDPVPLYSGVIAETSGLKEKTQYTWLSFSPFEIGSNIFGCFVPSWSLGRYFANGVSLNQAPPYALGYYMGIWGSAFAGSLQDVYDQFIPDVKKTSSRTITSFFKKFTETALGKQRLLPPKIPNFSRGVSQAQLNTKDELTVIDGGHAFNLPIPLVVPPERDVDIIIAVDVSGDLKPGDSIQKEHEYVPQLQAADRYMKEHGVPTPSIDYKRAHNSVHSVFTSTSSRAPAIVYLPLIKNDAYSIHFDPRRILQDGGFLITGNFNYTVEQIESVVNLMSFNIKEASNDIRNAIEHVLPRKNVS